MEINDKAHNPGNSWIWVAISLAKLLQEFVCPNLQYSALFLTDRRMKQHYITTSALLFSKISFSHITTHGVEKAVSLWDESTGELFGLSVYTRWPQIKSGSQHSFEDLRADHLPSRVCSSLLMDVVAHTCNLSTLGGWGRMVTDSSPAGQLAT